MDPPPPPSSKSPSSEPATTPSTSSTATPLLPHLPILTPSPANKHTFLRPAKRINTGADLAHFLSSRAYRDLGAFLLQLNRALCPRRSSSSPPDDATTTTTTTTTTRNTTKFRSFPLDAPRADPAPVTRLREMLGRAEALIDEAPPEEGPRRFGNASFRRWYELLEERAEGWLGEYLSEELLLWGEEEDGGTGPVEEVKAYFLGAFGSPQRLDYGTGHELSFLAFLGCLWKLGVFAGHGESKGDGEVERSVVLGVFEPYLHVVRRLILTYNLEPAGSHGVWGLDDHSFLPYIFGSAQLTHPITDTEPMPLEGSAPGAPRPSDVVKPASVDLHRGSNMYFSAIGFINDVKKGPFWEHSPILFDISGIKDGWGKINKGMIKMFNAEVLSKFPVVQHFPFGSLFSWDLDPDAAAPTQSMHLAAHGAATGAAGPSAVAGSGTAAPWTQATMMPGAGGSASTGPGIPYSRAPWAGAGSTGATPPRGGVPDTGPPPPTSFPRGTPGKANNQFSITKAPWAKD
ncbi:hypothetical protein VTK56DRAFT_9074 [Thermocarpiscus australiensis]